MMINCAKKSKLWVYIGSRNYALYDDITNIKLAENLRLEEVTMHLF